LLKKGPFFTKNEQVMEDFDHYEIGTDLAIYPAMFDLERPTSEES